MSKKRLLKGHFYKLMIRQVPMGCILSAETADSYPLRWSGSYVSEDGFLIMPEIIGDKYGLIPPTNDCSHPYYQIDHDKVQVRDISLEQCLEVYLKLSNYPKT